MHIIVQLAGLLYGTVTLFVFAISALLDRETWQRRSREEHEELKKASHDLWSLHTTPPPEGLHHQFLNLATGRQLHYLSNESNAAPHKALVLFLHGFPDSGHIFSNFLTSPTLQDTGAKLVSLDLPGYGGSDGLEHYGPDEVLNAVAEGLAVLRRRYLETGKGHCVVVGHDWGGVIASRLAAQTVGLIDRFVMVNSVYTRLVKHNAILCIRDCRHTLVSWLTSNVLEISQLRLAWRDISPLLKQLQLSSYIFLFNLPFIGLSKWFPWLTAHLLRAVHRHGHNRLTTAATIARPTTHQGAAPGPTSSPPATLLARSRALTFGPGLAESAGYGPDIARRARKDPPGDWDQRIRLYREGASTASWRLSPELQNHGVRPADWRKRGYKFTCPATVLFGLRDLALSPRICLDGMERYFPTSDDVQGAQGVVESHIVRLSECGHWSVLEPMGEKVLEETLRWLLDQDRARQFGLEEVLTRSIGKHSGLDVATFEPA
ncbi:Alpha/beta hydrolase family [Teratosphaeria destructans]|uniref:Alpha/beta hydrolase family n=1 Tax=Teratosphaeria destructans TaxID=418781 RepID=A0A9W7W5B5_9PEZI|nr:Alpha/beta hydrolase family [Teratosphaeria destructans]